MVERLYSRGRAGRTRGQDHFVRDAGTRGTLEPCHGQGWRETAADRGLNEGERPGVAKTAAMLGRVLMQVLGSKGGGLGDDQCAQQEQKA
jgi:hypothetical protein